MSSCLLHHHIRLADDDESHDVTVSTPAHTQPDRSTWHQALERTNKHGAHVCVCSHGTDALQRSLTQIRDRWHAHLFIGDGYLWFYFTFTLSCPFLLFSIIFMLDITRTSKQLKTRWHFITNKKSMTSVEQDTSELPVRLSISCHLFKLNRTLQRSHPLPAVISELRKEAMCDVRCELATRSLVPFFTKLQHYKYLPTKTVWNVCCCPPYVHASFLFMKTSCPPQSWENDCFLLHKTVSLYIQ